MDKKKVPRTPHGTSAKKKTPQTFDWQGPQYARIPPGTYTVVAKSWQGPTWLLQKGWGRWSIRIEFSPFDDPDSTVSLFCNLGDNKDAPHFGTGSKYYKWWTAANGGLPDRGEPLHPDVFFQNQTYEVVVDDAKRNDEGGFKADSQIYSHITELLSVTRAGVKTQAKSKTSPSSESPNHSIKQSPNQPISQSPDTQESGNQASGITQSPNQESPHQGGMGENEEQFSSIQSSEKSIKAPLRPSVGPRKHPTAHPKGGGESSRSGITADCPPIPRRQFHRQRKGATVQ